ncbi:MAG TPA: TetR/AcrR family transcriptional regulator [Alphaproteobacteria bacterium]|nr:TetR/AcrR family transcriptional regulator [Alphaproteobacteria bacterium]
MKETAAKTQRQPVRKSAAARPGKPEPRADRRSSSTHDAILAAAERLVRRRGYIRVTIEAIAAAAGAGKQTIYRWWPSKAALYLELYESLVAEQKLQFDTGSVAGDLRFFMRRLFRILTATPARAILTGLIAETQSDPEVAKALMAHLVRGRRHMIRGIFERGQARGEIRGNADIDFAVDLISGAVWFRLLLGQALDARFADKLAAQIRHGVAAR